MNALHELLGALLIADSAQPLLALMIPDIVAGKLPRYFNDAKLEPPYTTVGSSQSSTSGKTLHIPIQGVIIANDVVWDGTVYQYGTTTYAKQLHDAYEDASITEIKLHFNSPGGSVGAVQVMLDALAAKNKPVHSVVNGVLGSAAYWFAAKTDSISVTNKFDMIGSIGARATITSMAKLYESIGIETHTFNATQSSQKNLEMTEALKGNYKPYQENILDPLAQAFIDDVKAGRPSIKQDSLEGGAYYAADAKARGLVDTLLFETPKPTETRTKTQTNSMFKTPKIFGFLGRLGAKIETQKADGSDKTEEDYLQDLEARITEVQNAQTTNTAEIARLKPFETQAATLTQQLADANTTITNKDTEIASLNAKLGQSITTPPTNPKTPVEAVTDDETKKILAGLQHNKDADSMLGS